MTSVITHLQIKQLTVDFSLITEQQYSEEAENDVIELLKRDSFAFIYNRQFFTPLGEFTIFSRAKILQLCLMPNIVTAPLLNFFAQTVKDLIDRFAETKYLKCLEFVAGALMNFFDFEGAERDSFFSCPLYSQIIDVLVENSTDDADLLALVLQCDLPNVVLSDEHVFFIAGMCLSEDFKRRRRGLELGYFAVRSQGRFSVSDALVHLAIVVITKMRFTQSSLCVFDNFHSSDLFLSLARSEFCCMNENRQFDVVAFWNIQLLFQTDPELAGAECWAILQQLNQCID